MLIAYVVNCVTIVGNRKGKPSPTVLITWRGWELIDSNNLSYLEGFTTDMTILCPSSKPLTNPS